MKDNKISLFTAILINMNMMLGAGMYINPTLMCQKAGTYSYLGWGVSAIVLLPIVLCITQISKLFPGEGSFYSYNESTLGKSAGFFSGWVYFLGYVSIQSMQMISMREILIYQFGIHSIQSNTLIFNFLFFLSICLLSLMNLAIVGRIQNFFTMIKIIPVIIVVIAVLIVSPSQAILQPTLNSSPWNIHLTLPLAIFGYWGFEGATSVSHRIRGDKRNASRSILIGFTATVIIFTVFHLGLLRLMGAENLNVLGVSAFTKFLPITSPLLSKIINTIIPMIIISSFANAIFAVTTTFSFLTQAMAKKNLLFYSKSLSKSNKNKQPIYAIFMQGLLAFLFVTIINHKIILLSISNLGILSAFFFTIISLIKLQRRHNDYLGIFISVLGFISCGLLGYYSYLEIGHIKYALIFFALIIIGFTMFKIQSKEKNYE